MAIKFLLKNAEEALLETTSDTSVLAQKVDQYADLKSELTLAEAKVKPLKKEVDQLRDDINDLVDVLVSADQPTTVDGYAHTLVLGEKANEVQSVDLDKAMEFLGKVAFFKLIKVTIGDLEKYLSPAQLEEVIVRKRTGRRSIKVAK